MTMKVDPGFDIKATTHPLGFTYGKGVFGPVVENRRLDDIRASLKDTACHGPEIVYAISMDVGKTEHLALLKDRNLLFGVVAYAAGRLGREPVRSQGHIHKKVRGQRQAPPEVYEIWSGKAIILMQESAEDEPGRCFAVEAGPGEVVIVPPDWAHATISADPTEPLVFGAWCDREYGFEYAAVRAHGGLAWFPVYDDEGLLEWERNPNYAFSPLVHKLPGDHPALGIVKGEPIYTSFEKDPDRFLYVSEPGLAEEEWQGFIP
jgi:glucose-6-phosphate isomerase